MKHRAQANGMAYAQQRGAALIVSLLLLVVITLIGISGMQTSSLQERMSGNMYDRAIAMQAAEAALSFAEAQLIADANNFQDDCLDPDSNANNCTVVPPGTFNANENWEDVDNADFLVNANIAAGTPQYRIQLIFEGPEPNGADPTAGLSDAALNYGSNLSFETPRDIRIYRITARSQAPDPNGNRAIVALQTAVRRTLGP